MAPTALPGREMLKLPGQTSIIWAVFDPRRYRSSDPEADRQLAQTGDAAALRHYIEHGQASAHSPNIYFDEAWYRKRYPGVAAQVGDRQAESGFDSYCRSGFRVNSPHWLFSEQLYRKLYPDLGDDVLASDANVNGYDHYLRHGNRENRIGHLLFDPAIYRSQLDKDELAEAELAGPFPHYLRRITSGRPEIRTTAYFDPDWYLQRYPAVAEAIAKGDWQCALHHYLCNDTPRAFDPSPDFSESHYLARYPDIAAAVEAAKWRNGFDHFLTHGAVELRSPGQRIDLRYYMQAHASVRADLEQHRARDPFAHYLCIGRAQGLAAVPPPEDHVSERQANALFHRQAIDLMPMAGRNLLDFSGGDDAAVTVVMVLRNHFPQTLLALNGLRTNYAGKIQLVLIDSGSTDETSQISRYVRGATLLRFDNDIGTVRAYNAGLHCATSDAVLFLNNEVELTPGAIAAALRRLASDRHVGAVGGKIIRADGRLQEAGGIVWRNGATQSYLQDGSPVRPEVNFVREVNFCSDAFLMVRAALLTRIEGYDEQFSGTGHEAPDLCARITQSGYRVIYDPSVVVYHHGRRGPDGELSPPDAERAQAAFFRKHMDYLRFRYIPDSRVSLFARSSDTATRVLFIDDAIPLRQIGSGFVRSNDIIHVMASLGIHVTIFPVHSSRFGLASIYADMPDTVEVMHDQDINGLANFLAARQNYYDVIWIARTHNLDRIRPILERTTLGTGRPPRIVLDTEAIACMRTAIRAALQGDVQQDLDAAIVREFANAHFCQSIVAVNPDEAQKLRDLGFSDVAVLGHLCEPRPTSRTFEQRASLLFVGAIHQQDSPNYDGLVWFVEDVLPLVEQSLGWETRLTIAGYTDPQVSLQRFREHPRITLRGAVVDTETLYDAHRIFVAPTRFAAGTPYKVHEAASHGIPVVATELLCRQLGWTSGRDLLSADANDPAVFAQQIVSLYRNKEQWEHLRGNALTRVRTENTRKLYEVQIRKILGCAPERVSESSGQRDLRLVA
jgi:O-antigen biosynthesis protein